jgi:hypothetical protein
VLKRQAFFALDGVILKFAAHVFWLW